MGADSSNSSNNSGHQRARAVLLHVPPKTHSDGWGSCSGAMTQDSDNNNNNKTRMATASWTTDAPTATATVQGPWRDQARRGYVVTILRWLSNGAAANSNNSSSKNDNMLVSFCECLIN